MQMTSRLLALVALGGAVALAACGGSAGVSPAAVTTTGSGDDAVFTSSGNGPGGQPGCGSLPDVAKNFPVRQLITNTGWGTGLDIRPNPGIGSPCWGQWFQSTRAVPQAPSIRQCLPGPAPGPIPYPGAPPYGAPLYGPGGVPLWPGVPPAPPNPADAQPQSGPAPAPAEAPPLPAEAPALPAEAGGN